MEIKVKSLYLNASPRKVRPTLFGLRGQNAEHARTSLLFTNKKGAQLAADLLKSAIASAKENDLDLAKLYVKSIRCDEGPRLKRRQIKARGRSDAIKKRMCHLELIISDQAEQIADKDEAKAEKSEKIKEEVKKEK